MKTLKYGEIYPHEYTTVEDVIRHLPHFIEERLTDNGSIPHSATDRQRNSSFTLHQQPDGRLSTVTCPAFGGHSRSCSIFNRR